MRKESDDPFLSVKRVGEELREARERRGKQLDDVWVALKIRRDVLSAIEESRFKELPGRGFTIGYVGRYARYLKLDVEKLVERLEAEMASHGHVGYGFDGQYAEPPFEIAPWTSPQLPLVPMVLAGCLFGVLAAAMYSRDDFVAFVTATYERAAKVSVEPSAVLAPAAPALAHAGPVPVATVERLAALPTEIRVTPPVQVQPKFLPPPTTKLSLQAELLSLVPTRVTVTPAISMRDELLAPIPSTVVPTRPLSVRAELLPPPPTKITVTRRLSPRTALLRQRVQAQLPPGRRYGLQNRNSRITLRVHRPTIVGIRDSGNRIFIDRKLAPGDTYRAPNLIGLWLTAIDAGAVEIILDGASVGFAGAKDYAVRDLSLNPRSLAYLGRTSSQVASGPTVQAARDRATGKNGVSTPSSPAEKATTAELNRKLLAENAAKEAQAKAQYEDRVKQQKAQYEEQQRAWEKQQAEYQAQPKSAKGTP